jgi:hypothetical protein
MNNIKTLINIVLGAALYSATFTVFADQALSAANDVKGLAKVQAKYEQLRNNGAFYSGSKGELAYYYSELVPVDANKTEIHGGSLVETILTDCGFAQPKFLFGGLDPIALVSSAESNRASFPDLDFPYANFFAASGRDLGICDNYTSLDIKTGNTLTTYIVLFKSAENKDAFDVALENGNAPLPAIGFWCMWGLGNGASPHWAVPNNPQYAVYQMDSKLRDKLGLESTTYIGANYWPRTHGMGSPKVIPQLDEFFLEVEAGTAFDSGDPADIRVLRQNSVIFHDPIAR